MQGWVGVLEGRDCKERREGKLQPGCKNKQITKGNHGKTKEKS